MAQTSQEVSNLAIYKVRGDQNAQTVDHERIKREAKAKQMQEDVKALVMMDLI